MIKYVAFYIAQDFEMARFLVLKYFDVVIPITTVHLIMFYVTLLYRPTGKSGGYSQRYKG